MKNKFLALILIISIFPFSVKSQILLSDSVGKSPLGYLGFDGNSITVKPQKTISEKGKNLFPLILTKSALCLIYLSEIRTEAHVMEEKDIMYSCSDSVNKLNKTGSLLKDNNMVSLFKVKDPEDMIFVTLNQDVFMATEVDQGKLSFFKLNINTKYYEGNACLSPDGESLYFVSSRNGGYGGKDIYGSEKRSDGTWSEPYNLGSKINTAFDEESPFLMGDGVTLYFSSKGHDSFGGFDIFTSTLSDEGYWSETENIGFLINTESNELNYVSDSYGKIGYFASDQDTLNQFDIFMVNY